MPEHGPLTDGFHSESKEALYAILNLPVSASQDDIHHRYKELAVIFHPDRQQHRDEHSVKIAEERFRQIKRAYEVLTDPLQREVYDALGEHGLELNQQLQLTKRFSTSDELRAELQYLLNLVKHSDENLKSVQSEGEILCAIDGISLFEKGLSPSERIGGIQKMMLRVSHTAGVTLRPGVEASLSAQLQALPLRDAPRDFGQLEGTISHQFSPRLRYEATAKLYRMRRVTLKATYDAGENIVSGEVSVTGRHIAAVPRVKVQLQRQLYPMLNKVGTLGFSTGPLPAFSASISSSDKNDLFLSWSTGLRLAPLPSLNASISSMRFPGGISAKAQLEDLLLDAKATISGTWRAPSGTTSVSISNSASLSGHVTSQLQIEALGTRFVIPVVLAYETDAMIGMCALLGPSVIAVACYNFSVKPWLRTRRLAQLREKRELYRESIEQHRREAEETVCMLSESAHRRTEYERKIDGLVLLMATYGTSGEEALIDVTVALQAQVRDGQLMIPGGRSKSELLGFYDPSPGARKRLKIEYLFQRRLHTVEVGDFSAVVLPLRAHLAE